MNHTDFWIAMEALAKSKGLTCSGLARFCGLAPTALNKSKRMSKNGQPHWLSMGTLAKILEKTHTDIRDFINLIPASDDTQPTRN